MLSIDEQGDDIMRDWQLETIVAHRELVQSNCTGSFVPIDFEIYPGDFSLDANGLKHFLLSLCTVQNVDNSDGVSSPIQLHFSAIASSHSSVARLDQIRYFANFSSLLVDSANSTTPWLVVRESAFKRLQINRTNIIPVDAGDSVQLQTSFQFTDGTGIGIPASRRLGSSRSLQSLAPYPAESDA